MRNFVLVVSGFLTLVLAINIIDILVNDLYRLTEYGYGYLTGEAILLLVTSVVFYFSFKSYSKAKN